METLVKEVFQGRDPRGAGIDINGCCDCVERDCLSSQKLWLSLISKGMDLTIG